jgi:ketosteroid isomerase-like protein
MMAGMNPADLALAFVEAINSDEADRIHSLMADDHLFIDSMGTEVRGREEMREGWAGYFAMFPDFQIEVQEAVCDGQTVIMVGAARGTYAADGELHPDNRWSLPAAWRAVIRGDRVAVWQVFADNEPVRQIMRRYGK